MEGYYFCISEDRGVKNKLNHRFIGNSKGKDYYWSPEHSADSVRTKFGDREYVEGDLNDVPQELIGNLVDQISKEEPGHVRIEDGPKGTNFIHLGIFS